MIPLTNHGSSEGDCWGRDQIYPDTLNLFLNMFRQTHLATLQAQLNDPLQGNA